LSFLLTAQRLQNLELRGSTEPMVGAKVTGKVARCLHLRYTCTVVIVQRRAGSPPRAWRFSAETVAEAHQRAYKRAGIWDLTSILTTFQASPREIGDIFGVTRQAIEQWNAGGVPPSRVAEVGRVADVARRLRHTFKRERIPAIVRQPNPGLAGESVLAVLGEPQGPARVMDALDRLISYVPAP
jgi:hypothetical protein